MKHPMTPAGIEPTTFRFVAQHLNHCATAVPQAPRPHFTPGKDPVPFLQEVSWATGPVWTGGISRPRRDSIPDRPARSSVAKPTELPHHSTVQNTEKSHFSGISDVTFWTRILIRKEAVKILRATSLSLCTYCMQISHFLSLSFLTAHTWRIIHKLRRTTICYVDV